jgi:predicted nucleic acid-binding protein
MIMARMLDSNVLLDIITADAKWLEWSRGQFREAAAEGPILINPVIYSELAPAFDSQAALDRWLRPALFRRLALPYEAAYRASIAFMKYREQGGTKTSTLPDFYIGAQAEVERLTLVTRDPARYRTYFPKVELLAPEK